MSRCAACGKSGEQAFAETAWCNALPVNCCQGEKREGAEAPSPMGEAICPTVYACVEGDDKVFAETLPDCLEADMFGEFVAVLPHIQRGEVAMIGGGAGILGCVWMDVTGEGNDILTAERAFAVARGEEAR